MAQELKYVIRPQLDQASVKTVRDQLNALEQSAKQTGSGSGTGAGAGGNKPAKEARELTITLDELTKKYLENADAVLALRKQTDEYKTQLSEIAKVKRANGSLTDEQREQEEALRISLKDTNADIAAKSREMITLQQQNEATGNSYFEMEKRMRALSVQIKSLDTDTAQDEIATLTAEYQGLNDKVKAVDASMGNHQRNVGNYENSIRSAANALAVFQGPLGPIAGRMNAFATTLKRVEMGAAAGSRSMGLLAVAMKVLWRAMFPLAVVFTSMLGFLRRTERGQDAMAKQTARLKIIIDTLIDALIPLGEMLYNTFKQPKQAVIDLWEAIKQNLIVRFKSFIEMNVLLWDIFIDSANAAGLAVKGIWSKEARDESKALFKSAGDDLIKYGKLYVDFLTGVEDTVDRVNDGLSGFADTMKGNIAVTDQLSDRLVAIRNTEREIKVLRAEQNRDLQKARDLARDLSASFENRLAALALIRRSEMNLIERELELERERLAIIVERNELTENDIKANDEAIDQMVVIAKLEQEHFQRSMSLRRDETALIRQQNDMLLREARRRMDNVMRESNLRIADVQREMTKRGEIVELAERKMAEFTASKVADERLLREQYEQELRALYTERYDAEVHGAEAASRAKHEIQLREIGLDNDILDAREQRNNARLEAELTNTAMIRERALSDELHRLSMRNDQIGMYDAQLKALELEQQAEQNIRIQSLTEQLHAQGIKGHEAFQLAKTQITEEYEKRRADITNGMQKAVADNQMQIISATASLVKNSLGAIFGEGKAVATAQAIIDTLAGMNAALKTAGPLGWINAAAIGVAGFANVRKIQQTTKDSKSTSAPSMSPPSVGTSFGLVDLPGSGGSGLATQVAGMGGPRPTSTSTTIILDGEFDKEALAVKVRQGSNAISSRAISIGV